MKVVILAGGLGTRISEETAIKPKPMVEVGDMPILWHIMKLYSAYGMNDFVVCLGYKGYVIKEFFNNYRMRMSSVRCDLRNNTVEFLDKVTEPWSVTLIDTGDNTMTGGRLKRVKDVIGDDTFCLTYGDGVSDVNMSELVRFHQQQDSHVTLTAVQPPGRFGAIALGAEQTKINLFHEKPMGDGAWVNGGFFVCDPKAIDYIDDDSTTWEQEPLQRLAADEKLSAYKHKGFWQPMDTLRDKHYLEELWQSSSPPWKIWD